MENKEKEDKHMGNDLKETASKRIKELRLKHGYTMESLADIVGVSKSTVAKWENGYVSNMRQDKVAILSKLFNVSPSYILGYEAEKKNSEPILVTELPSVLRQDKNEKDRIERFTQSYMQLSDSEKGLIDNMITTLLSKQ